jgi:hypothetical protein
VQRNQIVDVALVLDDEHAAGRIRSIEGHGWRRGKRLSLNPILSDPVPGSSPDIVFSHLRHRRATGNPSH